MSYSRLTQILNEVRYEDRYTAGKLLKKYPNDYVHFGGAHPNHPQRSPWIPKFGINAKPSHHDPPGFYLYPISWLLRSGKGGVMYRMDASDFAIVRFDPRRSGVLVLNDDSYGKFYDVALRNGWLTYLERVLENPTQYLKYGPMDPDLWKDGRPGPVFYATADALANAPYIIGNDVPRFRWSRLLKGVTALVDEGEGIINVAEPAQVVVIDPRAYKVLEVGKNKRDTSLAVRVFERVVKSFGGRVLGWKKKLLHGEINWQGVPVSCFLDTSDYTHLEIRWKSRGEAEKFLMPLDYKLKDPSRNEDQIVDEIVKKVSLGFQRNVPSLR